METSKQPHIAWTLSEGVAVCRFRFAQHRPLEEFDEIGRELNAVADADGVQAVLLDLAAYDHITSRFLGILAALSKKLSIGNRKLALCRMRPEAQRAFTVSGLDRIIAVYTSEEEARTALGG